MASGVAVSAGQTGPSVAALSGGAAEVARTGAASADSLEELVADYYSAVKALIG